MFLRPFVTWLGLLLALAAPVHAQSISIDKVLVIVNDEAITESEYQARHQREVLQQRMDIAPYGGQIDERVLEQLINERIQAQIATQRGIEISAAEVDRAISFIAEQNGRTVDQLLVELDADGITPTQFRTSIEEQQLIRRLVDIVVNSRVNVSDTEVENYLASHRELIESDESFEVSHLFVTVEGGDEAEILRETENLVRIREAMLEGRSFEQSVEEFSDDPLRQKGGYLGWRKVSQLPELFLAALRVTPVGGVTEVIQSQNGLHLLKLHDRQGAGEMVQQMDVRHILLRPNDNRDETETIELAESLYNELQAGEDFVKLARLHSADFNSREEGGSLGWVSEESFGPEIGALLSALPVGQVSEPVATGAGIHLFEVLGRRQSDNSLEIASRRAREAIFQRKAAEFYDNWYGSIRDAAYIEYVTAGFQDT